MQYRQKICCRFVKFCVEKYFVFTIYGNNNKKFYDKILYERIHLLGERKGLSVLRDNQVYIKCLQL